MNIQSVTPILTLEVNQLKRTMAAHLASYSAELNDELQKAVTNYCTTDNLQGVVQVAAKRMLDQVMQEELSRFFSEGGAGRQAIRDAIKSTLSNQDAKAVNDGQ